MKTAASSDVRHVPSVASAPEMAGPNAWPPSWAPAKPETARPRRDTGATVEK